MSERKRKRALAESRLHALHHGSAILHALGCQECGLRMEALFTLAVLGWDEAGFQEDYFTWLLKVDLDA